MHQLCSLSRKSFHASNHARMRTHYFNLYAPHSNYLVGCGFGSVGADATCQHSVRAQPRLISHGFQVRLEGQENCGRAVSPTIPLARKHPPLYRPYLEEFLKSLRFSMCLPLPQNQVVAEVLPSQTSMVALSDRATTFGIRYEHHKECLGIRSSDSRLQPAFLTWRACM